MGRYGSFGFKTVSTTSCGLLDTNGQRCLLIAMNHLTGWPTVRVTTRDASDLVLSFVKERNCIHPWTFRYIMCDNAHRISLSRGQTHMIDNGIEWKKDLQYTSMSNKKAEQMVGKPRKWWRYLNRP